MRLFRKSLGLSALVALAALAAGHAVGQAPPIAPQSTVDDPVALVRDWQVAEAEQALEYLRSREGDTPQAILAEMLIAYYKGDYAAAQDALDRHPRGPTLKPYSTLIPSAVRLRSDAVEGRSEHFLVRTAKGPDELLIPYVLETMEAAWTSIGEVFDYFPEGPMLVEIMPDKDTFIELSTLSEDQVKRSGTIALCKWDHMLVITPRATSSGYDWRDTLTHEYVHLVLARMTRNNAPVWFHEGTAAFLEETWRGEKPGSLSPSGEALLADARGNDGLIPFETINNSMPNLPDAASVSLAFAEVTTALDFFIEANGLPAFRAAVADMRAGIDPDEAVGRNHRKGAGFERWEKDWLEWLAERPLSKRIDVKAIGLTFSEDDVGENEPTDPVLRGDDRALNFARLGDLLRERGRLEAALVEYGKAGDHLEVHSPSLVNRHAEVLIQMGRFSEARSLLLPSTRLIPDYVHTWVRLARVEHKLGNKKAETEAWRMARDLNPFHPLVHLGLMALLPKTSAEYQNSKAADALMRKYFDERKQ